MSKKKSYMNKENILKEGFFDKLINALIPKSVRDKIDKIIADNFVEIVPLSFMRGRTFLNSFIIVDEAQNVTNEQMEMILSRIGINSKMVICGDLRQNDLKVRSSSGFDFLCKLQGKVNSFNVIELLRNHRHSIVDEILREYNDVLENS